MIKIENIERLIEFMEDKFKGEFYDLEAVKEEVIQAAMNGNVYYELGGHETKSGHEESLSFEYTFDYNEELDETTNELITIK